MWVGLWDSVSEAQFKVLATQWIFSVVLNQGEHARKVQVWCQEEVCVSPL